MKKGEGYETAVNITSWVHRNKISLGLYDVELTSHVIVNCLTTTRYCVMREWNKPRSSTFNFY